MMTTHSRLRALQTFIISSAFAAFGPTTLMAQGRLTPPPGAPAPTMKTLDQIEPRIDLFNAPTAAVSTTDANYHFIITQPGSYYLSANLGVTKPNGILINAEGVTLDLNGFEISRASGAGGNGIEIPTLGHRASIRTGSIKGFARGIQSLQDTISARSCAYRELAVSNCTDAGITGGEGALLDSCRAHDNSGFAAIDAHIGSTLTNCNAYNNNSTYGIFAGEGSTLSNCTAHSNTATYGIFVDLGSTLTNCTASFNRSALAISGGIRTFSGCTITHCTASYNTSTVAANSSPTAGMGFHVGNRNTIQNCNASSNEGDGINISSDAVARENTCNQNGNNGNGAGIHSTSSGNRIEANSVTANDRGIDVDTNGNIIIKNSASGNTINYVFVANNVYGTIINRTAIATAAVSGDSAPTAAATGDPWANFAY